MKEIEQKAMITLGTNYRVVHIMDVPYETVERKKMGVHPINDIWIKEVNDSVILTREELEKIISDAWEAAIEYKKRLDYDGNDENRVPDKQQYIKQIIGK